MFDSVAKETFEMLPEEQQAEVVDFIMFLGEKTKVSEDEKGFPFDVFAGDMIYMADDFDETPDCFKEYV
ncbi:MAG: DUF2281 domain-containing protein [Lachnospiraceae bacterium]|nr:DUF2281 domain-containing protein [Lachnospiraceae bacterium]